MADPLSITASLLAVTTVAVQSIESLCKTVKRYKDRNKTLRRLQEVLEDLTKILESLKKVTNAEESVLKLLQGPIERCSQVCRDFEVSMEVFSGKSKTGFRDWTRMEFMRGDINEFIDTIAGYKSTISVGLGTINMHTSKISYQVLLEYNEMIQDTAYNLELHLQQIDEKITQLASASTGPPEISMDLSDEREVVKQCLRVCEDARSYLNSLAHRTSSLLLETPEGIQDNSREAQVRTRRALDDSQDRFTETIGHLSRRLESLLQSGVSEDDNERRRLQSDIEISKQCLDVCSMASEVSRKKVYIGEAIADGDSDQVIVTTLADLFEVGKAMSKDNSAQLIASTTEESLERLAELRYASRFGVPANNSKAGEVGVTDSSQAFVAPKNVQPSLPQAENVERSAESKTKPGSNEVRRRLPDRAVRP